ncbi:hypothetical protein [Janthinobacterium sp. ZB1P44]|uniref:hypothetical protein n=1 Tax=Janthinobacterium sp. ZB1P44 TaxID=3424192 RepID=UPI003F20CE79
MKNQVFTPLVIALTAMVLAIIWYCFAPGFMSYDSMVQYQTALDQHYTDSHPAIMSYLWHLCLFVVAGPQSLLIVHLLLLAAGILIWCSNLPHRRWALLIPAMFLLPWIINFAGVLWKDVGMAFALLVATGLLYTKTKNWRVAAVAIPFIFYASAVRHNAILAIVPLIYFALRYFWPARSVVQAVIMSVVLSATLPLATSVLSYNVLHAERKHFETLLMGDEVAKISLMTGENLMPWVKPEDNAFCSPMPILYERAMCFVRKGYDPNGSLFAGMPHTTAHALWKKTVLEHPLPYLQIKGEAFLYFLRSPTLEPYYAWHPGIMQNELGIKLDNPKLAHLMQAYVEAGQVTPLGEFFKPYLWLLLAIAMTVLGCRMRASLEKTQILALNASSLGYFLGYLASVPSADFRYIYWCIIATSLSTIIWLAARANARAALTKN